MTHRTPEQSVNFGDIVSGYSPGKLEAAFPLNECVDTFRIIGPDNTVEDIKSTASRIEYYETALGRAVLGAQVREVRSYNDPEYGLQDFKIESISSS